MKFFIISIFFVVVLVTSASFSAHNEDTSTVGILSRNKREVGVTKSWIEQYPFVVSVKHDNYSSVCAGIILSKGYIITSDRCLREDQEAAKYLVRAGSNYRKYSGTTHRVSNITFYPGNTEKKNPQPDLALLKLETPIELDYITTKAVTMFKADEKIKNGSVPMTAGWGLVKRGGDTVHEWPVQLHSIEMAFFDQKNCTEIYKDPIIMPFWGKFYYELKEGEVCTSVVKDRREILNHGDRGGPLLIDGRLAGILSRWGLKNSEDREEYPNVFVLISPYRNWIDEQIKE